MPADLLASETKTQKFTVCTFDDLALFSIHLEFQFVFNEAGQAAQYPFACSRTFHHTFHHNDEVIRIAGKVMTTFLQFLVHAHAGRTQSAEAESFF